MKKNLTLLSYLVIAFALVFTSCKKDDDVTPEQAALNALNGTWTINSGTTPDGPVTLTGVTINFNSENSTYSVSSLGTLNDNDLNYSDVFAAGGDFSLNSTQTAITLTPGGTVNYAIDGSSLTLSYQSNFPKETDPAKPLTLTGTK
jgi:hypothetical protein